MEAAAGLIKLGAESVVINGGRWIMNAQLDEGAGQALGRLVAAKGMAAAIADLVVVSVGVRLRDDLAGDGGGVARHGFERGTRGGLVITNGCGTTVTGVWAIGEDEWAATLADPEQLRRFRSFVNAPDTVDDSIVFVPNAARSARPRSWKMPARTLLRCYRKRSRPE